MKKVKGKIMLVEDDANLAFVIKDNLVMAGYETCHCTDGESAWKQFCKQSFDLCILDVMLPKKDGFSLARDIRQKDAQVPILFLTAKSMQEDIITGFQQGGDDYITKPFSIEELLLRIDVFLKRSKFSVQINKQEANFNIGKYHFDYPNLTLSYAGETNTLTQKEADILRLFCLRKDSILKREEILKSIWGQDDYFLGRSLDVFISKLRKYLKEDHSVEIVNYHGVGFKLAMPN